MQISNRNTEIITQGETRPNVIFIGNEWLCVTSNLVYLNKLFVPKSDAFSEVDPDVGYHLELNDKQNVLALGAAKVEGNGSYAINTEAHTTTVATKTLDAYINIDNISVLFASNVDYVKLTSRRRMGMTLNIHVPDGDEERIATLLVSQRRGKLEIMGIGDFKDHLSFEKGEGYSHFIYINSEGEKRKQSAEIRYYPN